jgi:hypothetical protein
MKRILTATFLLSGLVYGQAVRNLPGFLTNNIPRNDDGSSSLQPIGFTINLFGKTRSQVYVNNNGNVTFDNGLATYTPFGLANTRREIIAAYFADVDTRPAGSKLVTYGLDTVNGRSAFGVNYIDVGYYNNHDDKLNSFQLILIDRSDLGAGNFDIEFNYNRISWETGDASGGVGGFAGVPAAVGYSNGTGEPGTSFELDGSLTIGAFLDNGRRSLVRNRLNNTQPGRYIFRARNGQIQPPLSISTSCPLPGANLNTPYAEQFTAVGGGTNLRWVQVADPGASLPPGLTLSAGGLYGGTPTTPGTFDFTVRMTAATEDGDQTVASRCSITVDSPRLSIVSGCPLSAATVGQAYSRTLQVNGGRSPYTWSMSDDGSGLPRGLSISPAGVISGVPLAEGNFDFSINVASNPADVATPASKFCAITVKPAVLDLTTSCALPVATSGVPYSQTLTVSGGTAPLTWSSIGLLPTGLSLSPDGRIAGTPSVAAQFQFSTRVVDAHGQSSIQSCRLSVTPPVVSVTNSCPLPAGTTGDAYSQQLAATNGSGSYSWSVIGTLPSGLSLNGDGLISGRPMTAGPASFVLLVSDSQGHSVAKPCTLTVLRSPFSVAACPIGNATVGVPLSRSITADGGQEPYLYSAASSMAPGLSIDSYGLITGTPTAAGTFPLNVRVLDSTGRTTVQPCGITVAPSPLTITGSCPLPKARVGVPYSSPFTAGGGTAPYTFSLTGALPAGLTLNPNGSVTGTPITAANTEFQIRLRDGQNRVSGLPCSIEVSIPDVPTLKLNTTAASVLNPASAGPTITLDAGSVYSLPIQGTLVLTNLADTGNAEAIANRPDPRVRFNNGQTTLNFTIAPGSRQISAPTASTGTVAATITVSVTNLRIAGSAVPLVPSPKLFQVRRTIPVITDACFNVKATGIEAVVTGYTTTRQLTSATFTFTPAASSTVDLTASAAVYFQGDDSIRNGGAFTLTIPFTAEGGNIAGASLTLSNSVGPTASRTINRCQ